MPSRQEAIDAHCRECLYDPLSGEGTWREQIGKCSSPNCNLYAFRPLPSGKRKTTAPRSPAQVLAARKLGEASKKRRVVVE